MLKTVFICGTGRCGTTVSKRVLEQHAEVFTFPDEARFIEGPHGLIELYKALTEYWTPWCGEISLREFERFVYKKKSKFLSALYAYFVPFQFLRSAFSFISPPSYMSLDIRDHPETVEKHLNILKNDLALISYKGCWPGMPGFLLNPQINIPTVTDKEKVEHILNKFMTGIVGDLMKIKGEKLWLDDSIFAHLHSEDILKILPESKFIHIMRDPRDVVASFTQKLWAPQNVVDAARYFQASMKKWEEVRGNLPQDIILDVQFENVVDNPDYEFGRICDFMGIQWEKKFLSVLKKDKANVGRWKRDLSKEDVARIMPYIEKYMRKGKYVGAE